MWAGRAVRLAAGCLTGAWLAPQDVGLLFCSSMATAIAAAGAASGATVPEIMGTAMVWLAFSTVFVGICTCLVGKYKLATLVQYMPLPVVGACESLAGPPP